MRALLPEPVVDPDLYDFYARGWIGTGGVRVNFVESVDGAMTVAGLSRGLQTPGDNRVFAVLRDLADVVLVGAGTAAAESYQPVAVDARRAATRARFGLRPQLPIALVSGRLDFDLAGPLFRRNDDAARPIVITKQEAPTEARLALEALADVIVAGTNTVDLVQARAELEARGLPHILCEGGPSLFSTLLALGGADELCLTISPLLIGGKAARIAGPEVLPADVIPHLSVTGLLEEDGALFARYRIDSGGPS